MKILKRLLLLLLVGGLGGGGYFAYLYFQEGSEKNLYSFVNEDFVMMIESDKPVQDWQEMSSSRVWQILKKSEYFADIAKSANKLDTLLLQNRKITEMAKVGKMLITTHVTTGNNYDFLILVDLDDKGKLANFKTLLPPLFKRFGYKVSPEILYNYDVYNLYDVKENTTLTVSLVGNVLLASYTHDLVKKAIEHSEKENIQSNENFKTVYSASVKDGPYNLIVNYAYMDKFVRVFSPQPSEMLLGLGKSISFSGFTLGTKGEAMDLNGFSMPWDTAVSYINAFRSAGKGEISAQNVLPTSTVMFTSFGFSDFTSFYNSLLTVYKEGNPKEYADMIKNKEQVEKFLKIKLEEDFFSWMNEEAVAAVVGIPQDNGTLLYENFAMLHFKDADKVKEKLLHVEKQIKRKTLFAKFEKEEYQGYEIRFLEIRGLFKLLFKKLFSKIEKPHYVILDNYVIFANDIPSLKYIIDQYVAQKTLKNDPEYRTFASNLASSSNLFVYIRNEHFYDYTLNSLSPDSRATLEKNQAAIRSFQHIGLQIAPASGMLSNQLFIQLKEWQAAPKPVLIDSSAPVEEEELVPQDSM